MVRLITVVIFYMVAFVSFAQEKSITEWWGVINSEIKELDLSATIDLNDSELLAYPAPIIDKVRCPLLHIAAYRGDIEFIKRLIDARLPLNELYCYIYSPLDFAIISGKMDAVKFLISKGSSINQENLFHTSIIAKILTLGTVNKEIIRYLIEDVKIPLDFEDSNVKRNALRFAMNLNRFDTFKLLVNNQKLLDKYGTAAMQLALCGGKTKFYNSLKEKEVSGNIQTFLASPAEDSYKKLLKLNITKQDLIDNDIKDQELYWFNSLYWAIMSDNPKKVKFVMDINPAYKDFFVKKLIKKIDLCPLGVALYYKKAKAVRYFLENNMVKPLSAKDNEFVMPLTVALISKDYNMIKMLIDYGFSVKEIDDQENPVLGVALNINSEERTIKLLVENGAMTDATFLGYPLIDFCLLEYKDTDDYSMLRYLIKHGMPLVADKEDRDFFEYIKELHEKYTLKNYGKLIKILKAAKAKEQK